MSGRGFTSSTCLGALIAGLSLATAASAQDSGAASTRPAAESSAVVSNDDIVVTARRREETAQKVPVAISAFSGNELKSKGVQSLQEVGRFTAGLTSYGHVTAPSVVQFNMRGQTASDVLTTVDPAVGVYIDGVYVSRARGLNADFFDLERVEVLKGPQGTLYGRNTTGGAVMLFTRGADLNGFHGFLGGSIGQYNLLEANAAFNLPIIPDVLAVRLAYQGTKRDGFAHSAITQQDTGGDRNRQTFRASALFQPTETFNADLKVGYFRGREHNTPYAMLYPIPGTNGVTQAAIERSGVANATTIAAALAYLNGLAAQMTADPYTNYMDTIGHDDNTIFNAGLRLNWDLADNVTLKSITGMRRFTINSIYDGDGTNIDSFEVGIGSGNGGDPVVSGKPGSLSGNFDIPLPKGQFNHFWSQELNLGGTLVDDRLNWLVGGFVSRETGRDIQQAALTPALTSLLFANDGYRLTTRNWSIFTQEDFKITDSLSVTGGLRYTSDTKGMVSRLRNFFPATGLYQCGTGLFNPGTTVALQTRNPADCQTSSKKKFTGTSYLLSANWQVTDNILFYGKTARSFRSGTFQLRAPTLPAANPEVARDFEIGMKSDLWDRKLRLNIALYQTKYKDKQESVVVTTAAGAASTIIQNAADAKIKGFEVEARLRPVAGLTINGTLSYLDARYGTYLGAIPIQGGATVNASGEKFSNPPWNYSVGARYEFPAFGKARLAAQIDYSWQDSANIHARQLDARVPAALINDLVAGISGGQYVNGRASLGLANGRVDLTFPEIELTVSAFATNLFNHKYLVAATPPNSIGGFFTAVPGFPRMVGLQIKKGFGGD